jgi:uncharacterized membrane protein YhaH (DUF805 family)
VIEYLKGRSGHKEYWASIAILLLVGLGLAFANVAGASGVTTFLWFIVWGRRLHDFGKSAAWVLAPLGAMIVVTVVALLLGGNVLMDAARYAETGKGAISQSGETEFFALVMALLAVQAGFTIWLGVKAGDAGDNRFGPPPKDFLAR